MERVSLAVVLLAAAICGAPALASDPAERAVETARKRWQESPHGPMLERILPPTFEPAQLPDAASRGAWLVIEYCVQCHNLPNPAMHHAAKWPAIVERMVVRMRGQGNLGMLMQEMMAGVKAPSDEDQAVLLAYLQRHAQRPLDPRKYPEIRTDATRSFRLACQQCHTLPDPREPQLRVDEILEFLQRNAKRG